jgi:hypothetical protein
MMLFAAWKHGVVSADGYHLRTFCCFTLIAMIPFAAFRPTRAYPHQEVESPSMLPRNALHMAAEMGGVIALCVASGSLGYGANFFFHLKKEIARWDHALQRSVASMQMPKIRSIVQDAAVSYFGELPAPMVYNGLRFHATPATISFAGWNHWVMTKDAEFFRNDASAPPYLVYQLYNVPEPDAAVAVQFAPLDDALAQLEIFRRYDPVMDEENRPIRELGRLLLKRRAPTAPLTYTTISTQSYVLNTPVSVPQTPQPVQAVIHVVPRLLTRWITFFYKNPDYTIVYTRDDGTVAARKLVSTKAREGFLVAPLLLHNDDYLAAIDTTEWQKYQHNTQSALRRITHFTITCAHGTVACAERMQVTFRTVHGLAFGRGNLGRSGDHAIPSDAQ